MYTISAGAAAVTGARHLRIARNGQDAAVVWTGDAAGAVVVCDGCSAGAHSEIGARLGSQLVIRALGDALAAGQSLHQLWAGVHAKVTDALARIVDAMPGDRERIVRDHFLFTVVAAAWRRDAVAVWAIGDGGCAVDDRVIEFGPFANNQPPYLGYHLLGEAAPAQLEVVTVATRGTLAVATDGVLEVGLLRMLDRQLLAHPDGLRRKLAVLARSTERIDWHAHHIERSPAALQDDGAVAMLRWELEP